jgi:malate synthase
MAAFIPSRRNPEINEVALARVREDKLRESSDGFDGTWVAHPDLVPVATEVLDSVLGQRPHQKERQRPEVAVSARELLDVRVPGGTITEAGVRNNVSVALQYLNAWLTGTGAAAIYNLMEDAATAEISRAQVWQWIRHAAKLAGGRTVDAALCRKMIDEELAKLSGVADGARYPDAANLFRELIEADNFPEFLTPPAYDTIVADGA